MDQKCPDFADAGASCEEYCSFLYKWIHLPHYDKVQSKYNLRICTMYTCYRRSMEY